MKTPRRPAAALLAAFVLVFVLGVDSLRIVRDDWCNLTRLRALLHEGGLNGILSIVTNEWFGRDHRINFVSWLAQGLFSLCAGFHALPYFLFILAVHGTASLLLYRVLLRLTGRDCASLAAAFLHLLLPTATSSLFFLNNWFFVLPGFFAILLIHCYLFPPRRPRLDAAALIAVSLLGQFSGDQGLLLFPLIHVFFLLRARRLPGPERAAQSRRAAAAASVSAAALAVYWLFCVRGGVRAYAREDAAALLRYCAASVRCLRDFFDVRSKIYGYGRVRSSAGTRLVCGALGAVVIWAFRRPEDEKRAVSEPDLRPTLVFLLLALAAVEAPCVYAAAIGYRPDPQTRYFYLPGCCLAALAPLLIDRFSFFLPERGRAAWTRGLFAILAAYAGALTAYSLREVWGTQKFVDRQIWAAVDRAAMPQATTILTDDDWNGLILPFHSDAASDFQEDWGIRCRMDAACGRPNLAIARAAVGEEGDRVDLVGYYTQDESQEPRRAKKSEVMTLAYQPTPRAATDADLAALRSRFTPDAVEIAGRSPEDGVRGILFVFTDFARYRAFQRARTEAQGASSPRPP